MPLPVELDRKIQLRFDELIAEVETLLAELNEYDQNHDSRYREWIVKTSGLITMLFGNTKEGEKYQQIIERDPAQRSGVVGQPSKLVIAAIVRKNVATLKGIRDNYINGFYVGLEELIIANVSADYMEQAEALLGEGIQGLHGHVPAAVLCGAVLEDALRRLCQKQTPPIEIKKSDGQKKTMGPLVQDLQKAKVFNKGVAEQLRAWAKIRNYAAHGDFNEFRRENVDLMLSGVRHFLAVHL